MNKAIRSYFVQNQLDMSKIVDDYYNYISTIVRNSNIPKEDGEEIISDVFLILWKNQKKLDLNSEFGPYIFGITKRLIYKKYNEFITTYQYEDYENELVDNISIDEFIEKKSTNEFILEQLMNIGEIETQIFIKFYYEDKTIKEISKELNMTISNVKIKLYRTRKKLKKVIDIGGVL